MTRHKHKIKENKTAIRDSLDNSVIRNQEAIKTTNAIEWVKKQGYLVKLPDNIAQICSLFVMFSMIFVFFCISTVSASWYSEDLNTGLVGYYSFNEGSGFLAYNNASTSASGQNNGLLYNSPARVQGKNGTALRFTRSSSTYVQINKTNQADLLNVNWNNTINFWYNYSSSAEGYRTIMRQNASNVKFHLYISGNDNTACSYFGSGLGNENGPCFNIGAVDNQWHMFTAMTNGTHSSIFIDGTLRAISTNVVGPYVPIDNAETYFGRSLGGDYHTGSLDEIGIWNKTLSPSTITALYGLGNGLFYTPNPTAVYSFFTNESTNSGIIGNGTNRFSVNINNSNGTVIFRLDGVNYTSFTTTGNYYNISFVNLTTGVHNYTWFSYGLILPNLNQTSNTYIVIPRDSYAYLEYDFTSQPYMLLFLLMIILDVLMLSSSNQLINSFGAILGLLLSVMLIYNGLMFIGVCYLIGAIAYYFAKQEQ